ncbi:hypothetical protein [Bacillus atrophaeus]|uniref:hypothetical protein n=1 Tax=Bacillus atrophaeus TaxID=1452 RepID=UPI002E211ACE|nr:hypothetical protein [Bacillus atrophaeus]MED4565597.1 hypothetical protein [Bacillus atrophaeus]MED4854178.1 hypothetical protein [Bacillus atrophaeus]
MLKLGGTGNRIKPQKLSLWKNKNRLIPLDESEYDLPSNDKKEEDNQDKGEHGAA